MSKEKAQALLKEWQERLGLQEWRIKLQPNCSPEDMDGEECCGLTHWQEVNRTAMIQIQDKKYYGNRIVPFDFEKTLVHELLHLKMCLITDVEDETTARVGHMLIDSLARAFVDAKRYKLH